MIKNNLNFFIFIIAALLLISCDSSLVFEQNKDFTNETWIKDSVVTFNVEITDTLAVYNMYLNNRITSKYEYSNLYLFVDTQLPNGQQLRDTVECLLLDPTGKPLGKGFGNIWSNKIPYRMHFRFPAAGDYKFTLEQAMRVNELEHFLDAGLRIERAKF